MKRLSIVLLGLFLLPLAACSGPQSGGDAYAYGENAQQFQELKTRALQGDPKAQTALARLYFTGDGVERNPVIAYSWALMAVSQGHGYTLHDHIVMQLSRAQIAEGQRLARERRSRQ